MYREIKQIYRQLNISIDAITAGISYIASLYIDAYISTGTFHISNYAIKCSWLIYPIIILWPTVLIINGLYPTNRLRGFRETIQIILYSGLQVVVVLFTILFVLKIPYASRLTMIIFSITSTSLFIVKEGIVRWGIHNARRSGANLRRVLIVGTHDSL